MASAEEIQDDQIYLWDLQNELREIDARREEILHQINCVKLNKTQNLPDTTKMTPEEKPTDTKNMSAEEIDDRIYLSEREDFTQEEIEEEIRLKFYSRTRLSAEEEWNNYTEEEREFHLSY